MERPGPPFLERLRSMLTSAAEVGVLPPADHRPWPVPDEPWIMAQTWRDLLFAHWPVPPGTLRDLIPSGLVLETFDGHAWVAVTPFVVTGLRLRGTPAIPGLSEFPETNVRTYVHTGGKPGVFFFSLDAGSAAAVAAARRLYALPYFRADFSMAARDGGIDYAVRRTHTGAPPATCEVFYRPRGPVPAGGQDALTTWLTERYCLYAVDRSGQLYRAEIHHVPWPLQPAEAEFRLNTMTNGHGFSLAEAAPLLHFSRRLDVHVWAPHRVSA